MYCPDHDQSPLAGAGSGGNIRPPRPPGYRWRFERDEPDNDGGDGVPDMRPFCLSEAAEASRRLTERSRAGTDLFCKSILPFLWPGSKRWAPGTVNMDVEVNEALGRFIDHRRVFRSAARCRCHAPSFVILTMPYPQGRPFPASGEALGHELVRKRVLRWKALPFTLSYHMPGWSEAFLLWPADGPQPIDWEPFGFSAWDGQRIGEPNWNGQGYPG